MLVPFIFVYYSSEEYRLALFLVFHDTMRRCGTGLAYMLSFSCRNRAVPARELCICPLHISSRLPKRANTILCTTAKMLLIVTTISSYSLFNVGSLVIYHIIIPGI